MIRKSLAFVFLGVATATAAVAQTAETRPAPEARAFSMVFGGDGGYLGVETADVTKDNFAKFGLRDVRGVAVEKVLEGSPAAAAGLQANDVITRFNGEEVTSVRKLTRLIGEVAPDHSVTLTVLRSGGEREITATLAKRPTPKFENGSFAFGTPQAPGQFALPDVPDFQMQVPPGGQLMQRLPLPPGADGDTFVFRTGSSRQIGVNVSPLTKQLGDYFGVSEGAVLINTVRENSPAAKAGLKAGDVITEIDGKAVKSDMDLIRGIGSKKGGEVTLTVIRDRRSQTFRVTPEEVKGGGANFFEFPQGTAPSTLRLVAPKTPGAPDAPIRLNRLMMPGRVL